MKRTASLVCTSVSLVVLLVTTDVVQASSLSSRDDGRSRLPAERDASDKPYPFHRLVTSGGIRLYQALFSRARGVNCPMHPHCSAYAYRAFETYGPLRAYAIVADRLLRCGHDLHQYSPVLVDHQLRYSDPISEEISAGRGASPISRNTGERPADTPSDSAISYDPAIASGPEQALFRFASQLHVEGDYDRAITEYRRFISYYPDAPNRSDGELALLHCYYDAGQYEAAIVYGESVLNRKPSDRTTGSVRFSIGMAGLRSGDYDMAHEQFRALIAEDRRLSEKAVMARGLTFAHQFDWQRGEKTFASVAGESPFAENARYCARLCREGSQLGRKNPHLAGVLAIVPGLGYLYDGYYQAAMSALLINGLFMWGTYEAFDHDHPGLGVTLTILGIGWYSGNIYGSIASAQRRNEKTRRDLLMRFEIGFEF